MWHVIKLLSDHYLVLSDAIAIGELHFYSTIFAEHPQVSEPDLAIR